MTRIVIDISDEDFSLLREAFGEVELKSTLNLRLQSAVAHGKVLPEGQEWNFIAPGIVVCPVCGAGQDKFFKSYCPNCGEHLGG